MYGTSSAYSRTLTTGVGSEGAKAFKMLYAGAPPTITFVATGTAYTDTSNGSGYTLNKPAGVVNGDVLVAYVAAENGLSAVPPAGWTVVDSIASTSSNLTILMRDGLASDPSSWTGNLSVGTASRKRAVVVAYRGAAPTAVQFAQENVGSSSGGSTLVTTPNLTNADPGAWRLSAFSVNDNASGGGFTANVTPPSTPGAISYVGRA